VLACPTLLTTSRPTLDAGFAGIATRKALVSFSWQLRTVGPDWTQPGRTWIRFDGGCEQFD
jgi:hypothetical protein